jgi:hypothetical protein
MKKIKILLVSILLIHLPVNRMYSQQGKCEVCLGQFSAHMDYLSRQYEYATAYECTPFFGSQNQAGLSDIYDIVIDAGSLGVGTIFQGLDLQNSYNECLSRLHDDYNRGMDALAITLENCFYQMHCYLAGWGIN